MGSVESLEVSQGDTRSSLCISGLISYEVQAVVSFYLVNVKLKLSPKKKSVIRSENCDNDVASLVKV